MYVVSRYICLPPAEIIRLPIFLISTPASNISTSDISDIYRKCHKPSQGAFVPKGTHDASAGLEPPTTKVQPTLSL